MRLPRVRRRRLPLHAAQSPLRWPCTVRDAARQQGWPIRCLRPLTPPAHGPGPDVTKRDFLKLVAGASAAIGAGAIAWPLIDSMNPSKDVLALAAIEVDLTADPGSAQGIIVSWRGQPVFVRHRTETEIKEAAGRRR